MAYKIQFETDYAPNEEQRVAEANTLDEATAIATAAFKEKADGYASNGYCTTFTVDSPIEDNCHNVVGCLMVAGFHNKKTNEVAVELARVLPED